MSGRCGQLDRAADATSPAAPRTTRYARGGMQERVWERMQERVWERVWERV